MAMDPLSAAKAYASAGALTRGPAGVGEDAGAIGGAGSGGFGDILAKTLQSTIAQTNSAENAMAATASGRGDLVNVVTAVAAAEVQLETVLALRDQAIQAYQEIMRMPI